MNKFLKQYVAWLALLAALAGLYLAAVPLHLVYVFWIVVGGAGIASGATLLLPKSGEWITRIRNYPILLQRVAKLELENQSLVEKARQAESETKRIKLDAIQEGRQQVRSAVMAELGGPIILDGVALRNEDPILAVKAAEGSQPSIGARYFVEMKLTGDIMGIVEIRAYDPKRDLFLLECIDQRSESFWVRLAQAAALDSTPPAGVLLTPYTVDDAAKSTSSESLKLLPTSGVEHV